MGGIMADIINPDTTVVAAVSTALGVGVTAISRVLIGNRRTDKVDAVAAVAAAFDKVAERTSAHLDDLSQACQRLQDRVDYLERELRKRDELILEHVLKEHAKSVESAGTSTASGE